MRICEIDPGEKQNFFSSEFKSIWENQVVPNCKEIINTYSSTNSVLYRGVRSLTNGIFKGSSRIDRRPRDSKQGLSELFEIGLKHFGMTALRSNSIFTINNKNLSENFGSSYIIFPEDGFEYTYTSKLDITLSADSFIRTWANEELCETIGRAFLKVHGNDNPKKSFISSITKFDDNLFNNSNELAVNLSNFNDLLNRYGHASISAADLIDFDKFKNTFEPNNTGLNNLLISGDAREILIKGTYFAFDTFRHKDIIFQKLMKNK